MANLQDYVIWRGDLSFAERPLTELDGSLTPQSPPEPSGLYFFKQI